VLEEARIAVFACSERVQLADHLCTDAP
jgi:hypothetical protein